jgi:hypothetical protein
MVSAAPTGVVGMVSAAPTGVVGMVSAAPTGVVGMVSAAPTGVAGIMLELSCRDRYRYNPTRSWLVSLNLAYTSSTTPWKTFRSRFFLAKSMYPVLLMLEHFDPSSRFFPAYLRHFHTLQVPAAFVALPP